MNVFARILVVAVLTLAGVACASSHDSADETGKAEPADPVLAEMGAEIFERRCASCHGISGTGDGPAATALRVPPADLTRIAQRRGGKFPHGEIARIIDGRFDYPAHGSREMPIWGARFGERIPESGLAEEVSRGKIVTLLEYLNSIQQTD